MSNYVKRSGWQHWFFLRSEIDRILSLSMFFSVLLVLMRVTYTNSLMYLFLAWNLFLAYLPYALTNWMTRSPDRWRSRWRFMVAVAGWLLFIPNSFYIITDLFHLGSYYAVPLWFDLALILSFAWNGLILGIVSVRQMEKLVAMHFPSLNEWAFICPVMWLNALGVYIGRYLRFNSWDVITDPFQLMADISAMLVHPLQYRYAWGMVACFSVFMTLMYMTLKRTSKTIH